MRNSCKTWRRWNGYKVCQYSYQSNKQIKRNTSSVSFYINQGLNWSSVLNDQFSWGTVEKLGEILSNFVSEPVMTIGFFNDDIFEFNLFQAGVIRTRKYFCEEWAREEYGLDSEVIDHEYLEEVLELAHEDLVKLLEISNPEQVIGELSKMIQIHLWVDSEWISEDKELEERYTRLDIEIM